MKWSASEARRGDILTLSADVEGLRSGIELTLTILEYDADGAHDRITELPAIVKNKKIEVKWEYEYHEDTDEIATDEEMQQFGNNYNPPEYFFTLTVGDDEFGTGQESGILEFKDYIQLSLTDDGGQPVPDAEYVLILADGTEREGQLDGEGLAREEDVPPGPYSVMFSEAEE
jgi:hypothetical protein